MAAAAAEGRFDDDAVSLFLRDMRRIPLPTPAEQTAFSERIAAGDRQAVWEMAEANLRLVVHWATRVNYPSMEMADLVAEGIVGLVRACERFDHTKGFRFSTYASWWIRQAMQRANRSRSLIKVPMDMADLLQRAITGCHDLGADGRRTVTLAELAADHSTTEASMLALLATSRVTASLDVAPPDTELSVTDVVADPDDSLFDDAVRRVDLRAVAAAVANLPGEQRTVVEMRYGLGGHQPTTIAEIARCLGHTVRTIRHLDAQAREVLASDRRLAALAA